ncbi:armadillo-type protein [Amanita rubescens]|nr:armadillo-type protein [Amanita rubescens]
MPRENRKRGKKHKKKPTDAENGEIYDSTRHEAQSPIVTQGGPSWMKLAEPSAHNAEAPYGYVDNDVKAYFRTVDIQIRQWQENQWEREEGDVDDVKDSNDERRLFFVAALSEMTGKEKQLATDPDCSVVLERMIHSMDEFVLRVFFDSLAGSFETLSMHRFASHVCQTMFTLAKDTVHSRFSKMRGRLPEPQENSEHGELRTMTQLILDICEELLPSIGHLITDPFASHVVRSLLVLLSPTLSPSDLPSVASSVRSKKSKKWKDKQGLMTSVFTKDTGKGKGLSIAAVPPTFGEAARRLVGSVRRELNDNEVRALAANKAASPALKMLIEIEADHDIAAKSSSLMDTVLMGTVSSCLEDESLTLVEPSDFVVTLLRDAASSHLLETIIARCPDHVFAVLWTTYFSSNLPKLAVHPVANFVVSRAVGRVSSTQLREAFEKLGSSWDKLLQSMRIPVLKALVERASKVQSCEDIAQEAVFSAFQLTSAEARMQLIPCVLHLTTYDGHIAKRSEPADKGNASQTSRQWKSGPKAMEQTNHGSQLLQALLQLSKPHNEAVIDSLASMTVEERIKLAHNVYGSRIFDVLLSSPSIAPKAKRKIVLDFIGSYHLLVDDRIGSHIVDRCWEYADTYLKEKIARSLIPHDKDLATSYFGRFFVRNLNLQMLQRRPDEWRTTQTERKKQKEAQANTVVEAVTAPAPATESKKEEEVEKDAKKANKRKRHSREDEIDSLFDSKIGKKVRRAALNSEGSNEQGGTAHPEDVDVTLQSVLGAIKGAPDHEGHRKKKRKPKLEK